MRVVQHDIFCRSYFGGLYVVGRTLLQNISHVLTTQLDTHRSMLFDRITLSLHVSLSVFLQEISLSLKNCARPRAHTIERSTCILSL